MAQILPNTTKAIKYCIIIILLLGSQSASAQNLDRRILDGVHLHRNTSLDNTMNAIGFSAYPIAVGLPLVQFIHGFAGHHEQSLRYGLQSATGLIVATALTYGLKYTVQRQRPFVGHPEYQPYDTDTSPSFPSGHTSLAFQTATTLSIEYPKWYVIVPSYAWASAVGYSRIHLGEHYPSDVLAGALIGAASAYVSYEGNKWLRKIWKKKIPQIAY